MTREGKHMNNKRIKELDEINEDDLWKKFVKGKDQELRDYFVIKYAPLVKYVAGKISMGMPQSIEFDDLENKLGRTVEDEEIAQELGVSVEEFQALLNKLSGTSMLSLNDIWYMGDDSDELSILETLEAPENMNPDVLIEKEEIRDYIIEAIKKLPDKEKKVIVLYYYEDLTLKEIGEVLDVTESRVSQLHTKAIMRLRGRLGRIKSNIVG